MFIQWYSLYFLQVRTWLGVPYATPPLAALRFRPPRPALWANGKIYHFSCSCLLIANCYANCPAHMIIVIIIIKIILIIIMMVMMIRNPWVQFTSICLPSAPTWSLFCKQWKSQHQWGRYHKNYHDFDGGGNDEKCYVIKVAFLDAWWYNDDNDAEQIQDCLTLNIYRPERGEGLLPVLVWIHGFLLWHDHHHYDFAHHLQHHHHHHLDVLLWATS